MRHSFILAVVSVSLLVACGRHRLLTGGVDEHGTPIAFAPAPTTIVLQSSPSPEELRAAIARAAEEEGYVVETEQGQRMVLRMTARRVWITWAVDYSPGQVQISYLDSVGVPLDATGASRRYDAWVRSLAEEIQTEAARPGNERAEALAAAERQAREAQEREQRAQQDVAIEAQRAQAAAAEARAREAEAQRDAQVNARQAREAARQADRDARDAARAEAARAREEARIARAEAAEARRQARLAAQAGPVQVVVAQPAPVQVSPTVQAPMVQTLRVASGRANFGTHRVSGRDVLTSIHVVSGGTLDASGASLPRGCLGFVSSSPDVLVDYASPGQVIQFKVEGEGRDTTLIIRDPQGRWWCNDDSDRLDPVVRLQNPTAGRWEVWVGSINPGDSVDATLLVTAGEPSQAAVTAVPAAPQAPNCRALAMSAGYPQYASSCEGAEPYCAEAAIAAGVPQYISDCRRVNRPQCAVEAARRGVPQYISECHDVDNECALAAIRAGTPQYISNCR